MTQRLDDTGLQTAWQVAGRTWEAFRGCKKEKWKRGEREKLFKGKRIIRCPSFPFPPFPFFPSYTDAATSLFLSVIAQRLFSGGTNKT